MSDVEIQTKIKLWALTFKTESVECLFFIPYKTDKQMTKKAETRTESVTYKNKRFTNLKAKKCVQKLDS